MNKITRRQKQEALDLIKSRKVDINLAYRLVGWLQEETRLEINGQKPKSCGRSLAEFVHINTSDIRNLPVRK